MTPHLTELEKFAATDGSLDTARHEHLAACRACQTDVEQARVFMVRVQAADVPEPSPLFWDHFSARVRVATSGESVTSSRAGSSWRAWNWKPQVALRCLTRW